MGRASGAVVSVVPLVAYSAHGSTSRSSSLSYLQPILCQECSSLIAIIKKRRQVTLRLPGQNIAVLLYTDSSGRVVSWDSGIGLGLATLIRRVQGNRLAVLPRSRPELVHHPVVNGLEHRLQRESYHKY